MGCPVLPSLLVKLKYVNDLWAKRECCSGAGQELVRCYMHSLGAAWLGHYL